ncbi:hypothetical protein [Pannonibacter sp. SL95]|uniref:hypothetical protein n=1 Tax=Pannonibacter sp. SL95 TaxID=2995153 RepID=UPI002272CF13|nr:hypothetical protein [Pannonibacter sp. SL95]MCY1708818.1 hypothetical protein [Pannonibacter sp. SL95]
MPESNRYPDCVRFNPKNNSTVFSVTDENGEIVAVHEVFLNQEAKEIGRRTVGTPNDGFVRFFGHGAPHIFRGEPEDGMKLWIETGRTIWVDVSGILDTIGVTEQSREQ